MPNKYEILFQLAGEVSKQFSSTFQTGSQKVKELQRKIVEFQTQASKVNDLIELRSQTKELSSEYFKQKNTLEQLQIALTKTKSPSKELLSLYKQTEKSLGKAKIRMDQSVNSMRTLTKELDLQGSSLTELSAKYNSLTQSINKAKTAQLKLEKLNEKIDNSYKTKMGVNTSLATSLVAMQTLGAHIVNTLSAPIQSAMSMEDAMADINKVIDFKEPDGLQKLKTQLEQISLEIPVTREGLAQIAAAAAQAGVAENELREFAVDAARMGVAFDMTGNQAGEMMSKWRSGMALTQSQTVALADAVNALSNANAATGSQIGEVLMRYGALGKVAGLTEGQTAALGASLVASGVQAEVAATGIQSMMRALTRGSSMTALAATAFGKIGFDSKQLQKDIQKDAPAAIIKVLKTIRDRVPKELQMEYLTAMFGDEGARSMGPMLANLEGLQKNFALVAAESNYAGSMLNEFIARSKTTSNALQLASNAITYVSGAIGEIFLEPIKEGSMGFVEYAKAAGEWIRANRETVVMAAKVGGAVLALVAGYHAMRIAVLATISPFLSLWSVGLKMQRMYVLLVQSGKLAQVMMTSWKAVCAGAAVTMNLFSKSAKILGIALKFAFTNPVGLAITAVAALVSAGVWLYKNWDTVKEKMAAAWQYIADMAKCPINTVIGWINKLIEMINRIPLPKWLGGSPNLSQIPQLANGGIATGVSLAMVGEGSEPEAILPLSRLSSMLGQSHSSNSTSVAVNFAPVINIGGSSGNTYEDVRRGLRAGSEDLKREIERLLADERRLAY